MVKETAVEQSSRFLFALLLVLLLGCKSTERRSFEEGWSTREDYSYDYTSLSDSTLFDLMFHLEMNEEYLYKNINFELKVIDPNFKLFRDTVSIPLDSLSLYNLSCDKIVMSNLKLVKGDYRFFVKQIMNDDLKGVKVVKLRVLPNK